ncbi:MAG: tetratricopeptide (TPR) repeat protein, partial [Halioglobus sp.]
MMNRFQQIQEKLEKVSEKLAHDVSEEIDIIDNPLETPEIQKKKVALQVTAAISSSQEACAEGFECIEEELSQSDPLSYTSLLLWKLCNGSHILDKEIEMLDLALEGGEPEGLLQDTLNISDELLLAMYGAATSLYERDEFEKAEKAHGLLVSLNPGVSDFWLSWGLSLHSSKMFEPALQTYIMASSLNPENPYPHVYSAQCLCALEEQ